MGNTARAAMSAWAALAAACETPDVVGTDGRDATPREASGPRLAISDAVHSGGKEHFFFLPPLVPEPSTTGPFDGSLSPVVEVCRYTAGCQELVARFETGRGTGGATVDVDASGSKYGVNWDTRTCEWGPCVLSTEHIYRIMVLVEGVLLGYAEVQLLPTGAELRQVATGEHIGLVNGRTLPVKFRIEGGIVGQVTIGPEPAIVTVGETTPLTATVTDLHGARLDYPVVWESERPSHATVSATGTLSGVAVGCTRVTASSGGVSGSATVAVYPPGGPVITSFSRERVEVPHLDSVAPGQIPRGGQYSAQVRGAALCLTRAVSFSDGAVTGFVDRAEDSVAVLVLRSTPVAERDTVHAEVPGVTFTLIDALNNRASSGPVRFDIVKGPKPRVSFSILNGVTTVVRGQPATIEYLATVSAVGNLQFEFIGGPGGTVHFGPITGRYGYSWTRRITITYTPVTLGPLTYVYGNVDGAGRNDQYAATVTVVNP